jgi:hypothetical protein
MDGHCNEGCEEAKQGARILTNNSTDSDVQPNAPLSFTRQSHDYRHASILPAHALIACEGSSERLEVKKRRLNGILRRAGDMRGKEPMNHCWVFNMLIWKRRYTKERPAEGKIKAP